MADLQDAAKQFLLNVLEGADEHKPDLTRDGKSEDGGLSGMKGVVAGAGAAAVLPVAVKAAAKRLGIESMGDLVNAPANGLEGLTSKLGDSVGSGIGDKVSEKVDAAGGLSGILKDALPFGGGGDDDDQEQDGLPGVGKGRRMPVQQSVDIGMDIETVYNQWTQYEMWPNFMHRVTRVTQEDPCTVSFATKIWGKTKEFTAKIETQRPNERVKWRVSQGMTHTGVVTFHELGPHLTRVLLNLDVEPGGLIEKLARGARFVKRAARGDLHRFKALIEMTEQETGAWRGVIEDGELVKDHNASYDKKRDYADLEELQESSGGGEDSGGEEDKQASRGRSQSRSSSRGSSQKRSSAGSRSGSSGSRSGSSGNRSGSSGGSARASSGSRSGSSTNGRAKASSGGGGSSRSTSRSGSSSRSSRRRPNH